MECTQPQIEVFANESDNGEESVAILIRQSSIVEYDDDLVPGCLLSPRLARMLAGALLACAEQIDPSEPD